MVHFLVIHQVLKEYQQEFLKARILGKNYYSYITVTGTIILIFFTKGNDLGWSKIDCNSNGEVTVLVR